MTIVNEYDSGRLKLNHFDVYRVSDPDEIYAIGFDDYIFSDAVSIIEWANYIEEILPKDFLHIYIEKLDFFTSRVFYFLINTIEKNKKVCYNGFGT